MNMQLLNAVSEFYTQKFDPGSAEAVNKALSFGLPFSLFGFAVVFGVLAVIMFIVKIFGKVFSAKEEKPKVKKVEMKPEVKVEAPAPVVEAAPVADNGGIVAAIMAAISAFRASNGEGGSFRVVSFKKRK